MLLKNKIIKFIREDLNCSSNIIENSGSIIFTWNDCKCVISSPSLFSYNITLEDKVIFSGNYFQLLGFFKGYSQNPKEKLKLKDPSKVFRILYVKSHNKNTFHDLADKLAEEGRKNGSFI